MECKYFIKNGKVTSVIENEKDIEYVEYMQTFKSLGGLLKELIVSTNIKFRSENNIREVSHKTLVQFTGFSPDSSQLKEQTIDLMFNLRHPIFDKIKQELNIDSSVTLKDNFPHQDSFSCEYDENLQFADYEFSPPFHPSLLQEISY